MPSLPATPLPRQLVLLAGLLGAAISAQAAEGMWLTGPPPQLPLAKIEQQLGVKLDARWLAHQQTAAVKVDGASGAFVSAQGLVLTNHHVLRSCIARLSSPAENLAVQGFVAARREDERPCPGLVLQALRGIEDVSARLPTDAGARRAAIDALESSCQAAEQRCQVVALWGGARHHLYRYAVYRDARLVMAPEGVAASFGGDDDNFGYPRHSFDFALLRAYDAQGRPVQPKAWLRPASSPLRAGDPVFVLGHPGRTDRLLSVAQLEALRDAVLPVELALQAGERAALQRYAALGTEAARQADAPLRSVENRLKALRGQAPTLADEAFMQARRALETRVRAQAGVDGTPWEQAAQAADAQRRLHAELEAMRPMPGTLLAHALNLAALQLEAQQPPEARLDEYRARRDALLSRLRAREPFHPELETVRLAAFIDRAQQALGRQHPFTAALLNGFSAPDAAAYWVRSTRLGDSTERERWLGASEAAWRDSRDGLLRLALRLQNLRRPLQAAYEAEVTRPLAAVAAPIAQARWKLLGDAEAPDATGSLRLSFGRALEPATGDLRQPWKTVLGGLFARADAFDGQAPHQLSPRLAQQREALLRDAAATPLNFVSDHDLIGGSSGSPVVNAKGEWVGVAFDGNASSLGGRFHYEGRANRAVSVHIAAILLALETVYEASHLAAELKGKSE